MDIQKIISLVTKTQGLIKNREMAAHVKEKGLADYVTQVDIAVQNFLKKELFALAPDIQFLGEETGLQEIKADSFWILDGTTHRRFLLLSLRIRTHFVSHKTPAFLFPLMIFEFACYDHMPVLPFRCGASADAAAEFARTGFFRRQTTPSGLSRASSP